MFSLNERVVYPGHGVAKVNRIVEKKVGGCIKKFFELIFLNKEMTVLIPTDNIPAEGIRRISSNENINSIFKLLSEPAQKGSVDASLNNWSKKNKEYRRKLQSGNLVEIGEIYRDLKYISATKVLSYGEKDLLQKSESLLAQEISIVRKMDEEKTVELLRTRCNVYSSHIC